MKKILRIILIFVIAFVALFITIDILNMIATEESTKTIFIGLLFGFGIIALCIIAFVLLGKNKKR